MKAYASEVIVNRNQLHRWSPYNSISLQDVLGEIVQNVEQLQSKVRMLEEEIRRLKNK